MLPDCDFSYILPAFRQWFRRETVDQAFLEKDVRTKFCVVHRLGIDECAVLPGLFKTPYIVKQPEQPCKVHQFLLAKAPRNTFSDCRNPVGVRGFLEDHGVITIIFIHICVKY